MEERVAAVLGVAGTAITQFEPANDVAMGGLLVGLPALCDNGILTGIGKYLSLPNGFYSCLHILLTLAFMALGRIRRPEGLRSVPPGELGRVLGLDRVPEARTLREKVKFMAEKGNPKEWMMALAKSWMEDDPDEAGYLYLDGHVRVYHGKKANLPRRYVSRQRLCLRGTTDYWVNDALGRPFFVVSKAVTAGLSEVLLTDIVPDLLRTVPCQPQPELLERDPSLYRFVMVFDREGANLPLFKSLSEQRIAAITYRKNVIEKWPENEFSVLNVELPNGEKTMMALAKRQTTLTSGEESLPVTEVRRLRESGHQTAVITTAHDLGTPQIAARMFARWCQENYFSYMMQHYDIDGLLEYGAEAISGTTMVINPAWREMDKKVAKSRRRLRSLQAKFGAWKSPEPAKEVLAKAELVQDIQEAEAEYAEQCDKRREIRKRVTIDSLPEDQRPTSLRPLAKQLGDVVKMIAYRAETALVGLLRKNMKKEQDARALIRELFVSSADIEPNKKEGTLTVRIHRMANPQSDRAVQELLDCLTKHEFMHPETKERMVFTLV